MLKRSLLTLLLTLTLLLCCACPVWAAEQAQGDGLLMPGIEAAEADTPEDAPEEAPIYYDIQGHWAKSAIEKWSGLGVIQGFAGLFRPDDRITRGEMAAIFDRVFQYQDSTLNPFSDLPADAWYTPVVLKLSAAGILQGYQGYVRPTDNITRQEAVVMLSRALGLAEARTEEPLPYFDGPLLGAWAYDTVAYFAACGYLTDSEGVFRPTEYITRAEVVNLLDSVLDKVWQNSGLRNEDVAGNAAVTGARTMLLNSCINGNLFVCGGATDLVILTNTQIKGQIINPANAQIIIDDDPDQILFGKDRLNALPDVPQNELAGRHFSLNGQGRMEYHNGYYSRGIDVSEWQGEIDWKQVAKDNIDFAIIRLGYRGSTEGQLHEDLCYRQNLHQARAVGLEVGVYFFSQAITVPEAQEEARMVLELLQGERLDYPVVFDWETMGDAAARTNNLSTATRTACAKAFCDIIARAGYRPMVYAYSKLAYTQYDLSQLTDYDFWFAGYMEKPEFYYHFDIWQYTSSGQVAGIDTKTDMNICFKRY